MSSSFYTAGSGCIVQCLPAGGAKTTQITSNPSEVETSDGLKVHIELRAHRVLENSLSKAFCT